MRRPTIFAAAGAGLVLSLLLVAGALAQAIPWPKPTKDEIMVSVRRAMEETYLSATGKSIWGNTGITVDLTEPRFGEPTAKQLYAGKPAQPAWPVKFSATVNVASTKRATETVVWGGEPSAVWYFHKNAFGDWVYKIGSE